MAILRNITFIILAFFLTSCYEIFSPDIEVKRVLCINSLISAGEPIEFEVSRTWVYTEDSQTFNPIVENAMVKIFVNDIEVDENYIPKEGDKIKIEATSAEYGYADAEVVVPESPKINAFDWKANLISYSKNGADSLAMDMTIQFSLLITMDISDISDLPDYFHVSWTNFLPSVDSSLDNEIINNGYNEDDNDYKFSYLIWGDIKYEAEPLFFEHMSEVQSVLDAYPQGLLFFTDRRFSGSSYTLNILFPNVQYKVESTTWDPELLENGNILFLHTISKSYYDWENYSWQVDHGVIQDISDWGFADPIWGYSNVSTGAGVVAAQSVTSIIINLKDFLEETLLKEDSN